MIMGNVLDHLLKVEAEASALVNDAQNEADKRIRENEEKNRIAFDEKIKLEIQTQESIFNSEKEKTNSQYYQALQEYRDEISKIIIDEERFSGLLNEYLSKIVSS